MTLVCQICHDYDLGALVRDFGFELLDYQGVIEIVACVDVDGWYTTGWTETRSSIMHYYLRVGMLSWSSSTFTILPPCRHTL